MQTSYIVLNHFMPSFLGFTSRLFLGIRLGLTSTLKGIFSSATAHIIHTLSLITYHYQGAMVPVKLLRASL